MNNEYREYIEGKRLHPLSLLYRVLVNLPAAMLPLYFVFFQGRSEDKFYLMLALFMGIFVIPSILLNYIYFTYYITPDELVIKSGVLRKKQRNIPIRRIQNIDEHQNFLQKIFGITRITVETAGDTSSEATLESVSVSEAEKIRNVIRSYQFVAKEKDETSYDKEKVSTEEPVKETKGTDYYKPEIKQIFSMNLKDVAIYGMLRLRPVIILFFAWLFSIAQQFMLFEEIEEMQLEHYLQFIEEMDYFSVIALTLVAIIIALFLSWLADILLTINQFYNFKLALEKDKLHTSYGLLSTRKGIIPIRKLQMMVIFTNIFRRKLDYFGLNLETAGFGPKQGKNSEVAVPFAKWSRIVSLAKDIRNFEYPEEFKKVSKKTIRRALVKYFLFLVPAAAVIFWILPEALWAFVTVPLLYFPAFLRWQYRGYAMNNEYVFIKQGFLLQKISIVPIEKIQTLSVKANFFQRRLGLATVHIDTAAISQFNDASIIDIETEVADEIMQKLSEIFHDKIKTKKYNQH